MSGIIDMQQSNLKPNQRFFPGEPEEYQAITLERPMLLMVGTDSLTLDGQTSRKRLITKVTISSRG